MSTFLYHAPFPIPGKGFLPWGNAAVFKLAPLAVPRSVGPATHSGRVGAIAIGDVLPALRQIAAGTRVSSAVNQA